MTDCPINYYNKYMNEQNQKLDKFLNKEQFEDPPALISNPSYIKKKSFSLEDYDLDWTEIQDAVEHRNKNRLMFIGQRLTDQPYNQPLSTDEVASQILAMAPGNRPDLGRFILDLASKL